MDTAKLEACARVDYEVGDIVRLKSGGPEMTVSAMGQLVHCVWFVEGVIRAACFSRAMLVPVRARS